MAQQDLKKLKTEVDQLKKDNESLEKQAAQLQGSYGHRPGTASSGGAGPGAGKRIQRAREVEHRKDALSSLTQKMNNEGEKSQSYQSKMENMVKKIMEVRSQMGSVNITKEKNTAIDEQIKVLENRLDKALQNFNEALHVNKELREQIDNLRRERGVFDAIYKKLEKELQEKKKEMAFIIEVSNIAYEERDNAQGELQQLKVYASKEMQSFEETFKELDDLLEEDRKMKDAIKQRMAERKEKATDGLDDDFNKSAKKSKQAAALAKSTGPSPLNNSAADSQITSQNYEEALNTLRQATNISDVNQLVEKFLHSEDDNFSLFNFVNELNNDIEKLEEARNEIKTELDKQGSNGSQGDQSRQIVLKHLEERLNKEEHNAKQYSEMADKTSKLLEQIIGCVDKLFNVLECDENKIIEQQGTAGLTENTLHLYLAAIELRTDEHLMKWRRLHGTADRGPAHPFGSTNISIDIPTTGDDYNDGYSDEEERVLTRDELLAKTNQKLAKQHQAQEVKNRLGAKGGKKKKNATFS